MMAAQKKLVYFRKIFTIMINNAPLKKISILIFLLSSSVFNSRNILAQSNNKTYKIDLSGVWAFQMDSLDRGIDERWFTKKLNDKISLPGSMTSNGKGDDVTVNTPWTGSIFDSSWFTNARYAPFRKAGNIQVPFWLQPVKYYKGAAWYQKTVTVPPSWKEKHIEFFIERSHWETIVWVDDKKIGMQDALGTPHVFDLSETLTPGVHRVTVRVDNRIKDVNVGPNSHSITDHTQTNWNGMIGKLFLSARAQTYIDDVQIYPDVKGKQIAVRIKVINIQKESSPSVVTIAAVSKNGRQKLKAINREIGAKDDSSILEVNYPMGDSLLLWDEFHPNVYSLKVSLQNKEQKDEVSADFGMRDFSVNGTQFAINGRLVFLRGTLECAIFPKTGYPPTDTASWMRIFRTAKSFGLNHFRFHSWCPPEAAFEAADVSGIYLQIECSSWANWGTSLGDGKPIDQYIYDESERIVKAYGNHPSFCMLAYGNEPAGENHVAYLKEFVTHWKKKDRRRLYTTAAGWPSIAENDYQSDSHPRIQLWAAGLKSIINSEPPKSDYDWNADIEKWKMPVVSHEIGQWCVYPDFKEIKKYTGVVRAKNFEIFRYFLQKNGMAHLADSFLLASGKLQALCYKADIEAALRTKGFGGFQLLDLHDFPGQGTALVGVLNPFWEEKGYITAKEYSRFCNAVVPLARFPKMVYYNNEELTVPAEVANFDEVFKNIVPSWTIKNVAGKVLFKGSFPAATIPRGNGIALGTIKQSLLAVTEPAKLILSIAVGKYENTWDFFAYPSAEMKRDENILITQTFDDKAITTLNNGGKVLLTLQKGSVKAEHGGAIQIGFSSIFWNTAWTKGQPPLSLGILCNPKHPAFKKFPTDYYSNWQWWDAMSHSNVIILDSVAKGLQPIVRVIDDWVTARPLALVFECKVGKGKLLVSTIDLLADQQKRPEAKQLLKSLVGYMGTADFNPGVSVSAGKIKGLLVEKN